MTTDTISKENLSRDFLLSVFEAAFMDPIARGERSILVAESGVNLMVTVPQADRVLDYIVLSASWGLRKDIAREVKLEHANKLNIEYLAVRAMIDDAGDVLANYYFLLPAEISKKYFILVFKRFAIFSKSAVNDIFKDLLM